MKTSKKFTLQTQHGHLRYSSCSVLTNYGIVSTSKGRPHPLSVNSLLKVRYGDDIFGGVGTLKQLEEKAEKLELLYMAGGFPSSKWNPNHSKFSKRRLSHSSSDSSIDFDNESAKIFGLRWLPHKDVFTFSPKLIL